MTDNSNLLLADLRPLVATISREVLDQLAPEESPMVDLFMGSYYEPLILSTDIESNKTGEDVPLAIGTPDIWAALIIPLVLNILTELVKEGVIPVVKKSLEEKKKRSKHTTIEITERIESKAKPYEAVIKIYVKNPRLAKKIIDTVIAVIKSNL